jgi:hypothetical protein
MAPKNTFTWEFASALEAVRAKIEASPLNADPDIQNLFNILDWKDPITGETNVEIIFPEHKGKKYVNCANFI